MKTCLILALALFMRAAVSSGADLPTIPKERVDFHFATETNLPPEIKAAIGAAAAVIGKNEKHPDPATHGWIYRVTRDESDGGFSVMCSSYTVDTNGSMLSLPGGFCTVILDKKLKVKRVVPGA